MTNVSCANLDISKGGKYKMITIQVHGGNGERAIRQLKRRMQYELIFRLMKEARFYEPKSEERVRKAQETERRKRKNTRRKVREGA